MFFPLSYASGLEDGHIPTFAPTTVFGASAFHKALWPCLGKPGWVLEQSRHIALDRHMVLAL